MDDHQKLIDEIFRKPLQQTQIFLLRKTFLEYVEIDLVGNYSSASLEIEEKCAVTIDHETLSRFANNINRRNPDQDFNSSPTTQRVIASYLSRPETHVLPLIVLKETDNHNSQAPLRLAEFFGTTDPELWSGYAGEYQHFLLSKGADNSLSELNISYVDGYPICRIYERIFKSSNAKLGWEEERDEKFFPRIATGWGVFVKTDMLLLMLGKSVSRKKHVYITAAQPQRYSTGRISSLKLFKHNKLLTPSVETKNNDLCPSFDEAICGNIIEFQRIVELSGNKAKNMQIMKDKGDDQISEEERRKQKEEAKRKLLGQTRFRRSEEDQQLFSEKEPERSVMEDDIEPVKEEDRLGMLLVYEASELNQEKVRELVEQGAPVSYVDPETGATAIHYLAAHGRWDTVQYLLDTGKCNLLIRDKQGHLPSTYLAMGTGDMEWCKKMMHLEREQGRKLGIIPRTFGDQPIGPDSSEP